MTLHLPEAIEPFCTDDHDWHDPAAYALDLAEPDDPASACDAYFETRPPWLGDLLACERAIYVGATGDLLSRLEDHRDGEHRKASLVSICAIDGLRSVWWAADFGSATVQEYNLAGMLGREYPEAYVHTR